MWSKNVTLYRLLGLKAALLQRTRLYVSISASDKVMKALLRNIYWKFQILSIIDTDST
jgi:hypothetical protein